MKTASKAFSLVAALAATLATSQAAIVTVANYHLGEAGSVSGAGNFPLDSLSTDIFVGQTGPAAVVAVTNPGSTAALNFVTNSGYYQLSGNRSFGGNLTVTDNFGIQLWLKPTAFGQNATTQPDNLFFTTEGGANVPLGLSFGITGNTTSSNWTVGISNSTITGSAVAYDTWTSFGVIRSNNTTSLYINGALSGNSVTTSNPSIVKSSFHLGVTPGGGTRYYGMIDELNVFTFDPNTDNPVSALNAVPEPTVTMLAIGGIAGLAFLRRRRS